MSTLRHSINSLALSRLISRVELAMYTTPAAPSDAHFARMFRGDSLAVALQRHKHLLFSRLRLRPGMRVLDVGCGFGSAARELAFYADVNVVGVDSDVSKVREATSATYRAGLSHRITFVHVPDLKDLCRYFPDGSFDAVYSIESLKGSSFLSSLYPTLADLLRQGGKLATYEWCWTNSFDPTIADHVRLAEVLEQSADLCLHSCTDRSSQAAVSALQQAGFDNVYYDDVAGITTNASLPWYSYLDTALSSDATVWADRSGKLGAFGSLTREAAVILSLAGHLQLFTPMAILDATRR